MCRLWYSSVIPDTKPNQPGTALTKRKERSKRAENGQKDSLRPNSPRADKSDASDNDVNGDAEDADVSVLVCCVGEVHHCVRKENLNLSHEQNSSINSKVIVGVKRILG